MMQGSVQIRMDLDAELGGPNRIYINKDGSGYGSGRVKNI
jgi:hypothetical protein